VESSDAEELGRFNDIVKDVSEVFWFF